MDFENDESPSQSSLFSTCTPPNPNSLYDSSNQLSHKRKAGRKKFRETRHPVYRGVRQRNGNKWVCEIREPNKKSRIWVGTYPTPEIAARAHDVAVLSLSGTSANFNFPHSVSLLPIAKSRSAIDIRAAAAKATTITTEATSKPNTTFSSSHNINSSFGENGNGEDLCLDISMHGLEATCDEHESETTFFDEEAVYNMPGLLDSMAEGLLITPPYTKTAMDWDDNIGCEIDFTLWNN